MFPLPRRLLLVVFAFLFLAIPMLACGGSGARPAPAVIRRVVLDCPDCQASGMPANIWNDQALSSVACRLEWGDVVNLLEVSSDGSAGRVQGGNCTGWVRSSLYRNMIVSTSKPAAPTAKPPTSTPKPPAGPPEALVDTQALANPSVGSDVVANVAAGELLDLVLTTADGRWYQTATGGWVHAATVANAPQGLPVFGLVRDTPTPEVTPTPTPVVAAFVATSRGGANLRAGPYEDAEIVGKLKKGQAVPLAGISRGGMWAVTTDGLWLLSQVLEDIPADVPVVEVLPTPVP